MSGICIDITDRKQAEEALRQSREDLDRAQEVGQIGSWRLDVRRNVLTGPTEPPSSVPRGRRSAMRRFWAPHRTIARTSMKHGAGLRAAYDIEHRIVTDGRIKWVRESLEVDDGFAAVARNHPGHYRCKRAEQRLESPAEKEPCCARSIIVKNNLQVISSLVSLQADALADQPRGFGEVQDRVRSMALVLRNCTSRGLAKLNRHHARARRSRSGTPMAPRGRVQLIRGRAGGVVGCDGRAMRVDPE
jgi:two-component sensor histidine kinase